MFLAHEYESLRFLGKLTLHHNKIAAVPEIPQENITHLDLSDNLIETAKEFKGHRNMRDLNLQNNKLESVQGLSNMPSLEQLNLSNNQISDISAISKVGKLKKLILKNNPLENCSSFTAEHGAVTYLDLNNT